MTKDEERRALCYDPWGFDETPYHLLSDKFVVVRKPHGCQNCAHKIRPGQRVRARAELNLEEGLKATFYWCIQCSEAMARVDEDSGQSLERRLSMFFVKDGRQEFTAGF